MKLYHASHPKNRNSILANGLKRTKEASGYGDEPKYSSVYLYHQYNIDVLFDLIEMWGSVDVYEVEISFENQKYLKADEDTERDTWRKSLNTLGTCRYTRNIPPEMIRWVGEFKINKGKLERINNKGSRRYNMNTLNTAVLYSESAGQISQSRRPITRKYTKEGSIVWVQEFLTFDRTTRNGNNFKIDEFKIAIDNPYVQERIKGKRFFGELDHPSKENFERFTSVELKNICFRINKLWFEGQTLFAECETIETPNGKIVRALIEADAEIAVSFRGYGIPKPEGGEDIVIVAWDVVYHPSDPTALSKEESFKDKMYAEGFSHIQMIAKAHEVNMLAFENFNTNSHIYAESAGFGIVPDQVIKLGNEVVGFTFTTNEAKALNSASKAFKSRLKGF